MSYINDLPLPIVDYVTPDVPPTPIVLPNWRGFRSRLIRLPLWDTLETQSDTDPALDRVLSRLRVELVDAVNGDPDIPRIQVYFLRLRTVLTVPQRQVLLNLIQATNVPLFQS
jgi:hypothetical protein